MILHELTGGREDHPAYQALEVSNGGRQYDFLRSVVHAAIELNKPFLSQTVIKALNFQAISCLHTNAGEYRPCPVTVGEYSPPEHYRVQALMDDFINEVNRHWEKHDPVFLAAYVLWRLNWIHPFINGNGRTARAACYYVLCLRLGVWPGGSTILPELLRQNRSEYVAALRAVDSTLSSGAVDLAPLYQLIARLLVEQVASAAPGSDVVAPPALEGPA